MLSGSLVCTLLLCCLVAEQHVLYPGPGPAPTRHQCQSSFVWEQQHWRLYSVLPAVSSVQDVGGAAPPWLASRTSPSCEYRLCRWQHRWHHLSSTSRCSSAVLPPAGASWDTPASGGGVAGERHRWDFRFCCFLVFWRYITILIFFCKPLFISTLWTNQISQKRMMVFGRHHPDWQCEDYTAGLWLLCNMSLHVKIILPLLSGGQLDRRMGEGRLHSLPFQVWPTRGEPAHIPQLPLQLQLSLSHPLHPSTPQAPLAGGQAVRPPGEEPGFKCNSDASTPTPHSIFHVPLILPFQLLLLLLTLCLRHLLMHHLHSANIFETSKAAD